MDRPDRLARYRTGHEGLDAVTDAPEALRVMHSLFQASQGGARPTSALQLWIEPTATGHALALNRYWHSRLPRMGRGSVNIQFPSYVAGFDGRAYAVAIWSNPVARLLPQREWLELRRLAIAPDAPRNTASRMLRIMALLIRRSRPWVTTLVSYQDTEVHTGGIYRAAGWVEDTPDGSQTEWGCPSRPRPPSQSNAPKRRWLKALTQ